MPTLMRNRSGREVMVNDYWVPRFKRHGLQVISNQGDSSNTQLSLEARLEGSGLAIVEGKNGWYTITQNDEEIAGNVRGYDAAVERVLAILESNGA